MAPTKHPCIVCQKNVTTNSIACSVCQRWCHASCSDLDAAVIKYFETQHAQTGTHSWSCTGCNIAYTKLNNRIRQLENKQAELEKAVKANQEETAKNTDRLDEVEKDVTEIRKEAKKDRDEIVQLTTSKWSKEMMERKAREGNLVVYGMSEPPADIKSGPERQRRDKVTTGDLFKALQVDVLEEDVKFAARVGKMTETVATKPRPLKICFRDTRIREKIFANAKLLPRTEFRDVSIVPDLTDMQRRDDKDLFKEAEKLNEEMDADMAENYFYRCIGRRGERTIVRLKKTDRNRNTGGNRMGGNRISGNRRNSGVTRAQVESDQVRIEAIAVTDNEEQMEEETDNNKRVRPEDSDDSAQDSPSRTVQRPQAKRTNKNKST